MSNQIMGYHIVDPDREWKSDRLIKENKYDEWFSNIISPMRQNTIYHFHMKDGEVKLNSFLLLYFKDFAVSYGTGLYNNKNPKTEQELISLINNMDYVQKQYDNVGLMISKRHFMTDDYSSPSNPILFTDIDKGIDFLRNRVDFKDKHIKTSIYISGDNIIHSNNLLDFLHDKNDHYLCYEARLVPFI